MWFKEQTPNGVYYTPFATSSKTTYIPVGPGDRRPTPNEWADTLRTMDGDFYEENTGGYIKKYDRVVAEGEMEEIPGGTYHYKKADSDNPERLCPFELRRDGYVNVTQLNDEVKKDVDEFLNNEKLYRDCQDLYKIGFLFYGEPGTGKSSLIRELLHHGFPNDTITIFLYTLPSSDFLLKIQETLKDRLKIFVFEELATVVDIMPLHMVLNFLDGEYSIDRSITFATTNYPEKLPRNLVDRPGRFDKRHKIGYLRAEDRQKLLEFYLRRPVEKDELAATINLSAASLKEISRLVHIKRIPVVEAVKRLKEYSDLVKKEFGEHKPLGLGRENRFYD